MEEQDVKKKIIKGAEGLFMKYGVRSISMDDIARHLSVSKKTLYQHFEDKEDIVTMACTSHIERITQQLDQAQRDSINAIDEISKTSACLRQTMEELNPSLFLDLRKFHPKAWNVWVEHKHNVVHRTIVRNLKQGIQEGFFRPEMDLDVMATTRLELVQLAFDDKIFPNSQYKLAEVQMQLFEHFVYGLLTEKGRKQYQKCKENQVELSNP